METTQNLQGTTPTLIPQVGNKGAGSLSLDRGDKGGSFSELPYESPLGAAECPYPQSIGEYLKLWAREPEIYSKEFFPNTVRSPDAPFHKEMWELLEGGYRKVGLMCFRESAKTTKLRLYISRQLAFSQSKTILVVSKAQKHSMKTLQWIKNAITYNRHWSSTFRLEKGAKWSEEEIVVQNHISGERITLLAYGITSHTRGINIDDYRPDLIVVDDPCDEENTLTFEQREKIADLFFGSLYNSLTPSSENPKAKIVLLQTLLHPEDLISRCIKAPDWATKVISVYDSNGESNWPSRWTTEQLDKEKADMTAMGMLPVWMREKECKIVSAEMNPLKGEWLKSYNDLPEEANLVLALDPVPSHDDRKTKTGKRDFQAWVVVAGWGQKRYLVESILQKEPLTEETLSTFFMLLGKYPQLTTVIVETTAFQKTLESYFKREMRARGVWKPIIPFNEKRSKFDRIVQEHTRVAARGNLYLQEGNKSHQVYRSHYETYNLGNKDTDDLLDATSMALWAFSTGKVAGGQHLEALPDIDSPQPRWRVC